MKEVDYHADYMMGSWCISLALPLLSLPLLLLIMNLTTKLNFELFTCVAKIFPLLFQTSPSCYELILSCISVFTGILKCHALYMFLDIYLIINLGCNVYFSSDCDLPSDYPFPSQRRLLKYQVSSHTKSYFKEVIKFSPLPCPIHLKKCCQGSINHNYSVDENKIFPISQPTIKINCYDAIQILIFSLCSTLFFGYLLWISPNVKYVEFNTDLSLQGENSSFSMSVENILTVLCLVLLELLLNECEIYQLLLLISLINSELIVKICFFPIKKISSSSSVSSFSLLFYVFSISFTPLTCIMCLFLFQIWCYSYIRLVYLWLLFFLILISNDIELNPGDHYHENLFNFMCWNLNSLVKDNVQLNYLK